MTFSKTQRSAWTTMHFPSIKGPVERRYLIDYLIVASDKKNNH